MEREAGGGIGMGNTCKPMAVSFQCMTKFTTNKKKKKEGGSHCHGVQQVFRKGTQVRADVAILSLMVGNSGRVSV